MAINLADYVPVAERLSQALADGIRTITTTAPVMLTDYLGHTQVTVTLADGRSATGTASFRLDLTGKSAQATCPVEDAETSALGRALAFLGYESRRGVASREEVVEAVRRAEAPRKLPRELTGPVAKVQAARNTKDALVVRFTLADETYTIYNADPAMSDLADGDVLIIRPDRPAKVGYYATVTSWQTAPQFAD